MKRMHLLIMLAAFCLYGHAQSLGKVYAVLVGVSEYKERSNNLANCHKDAMDMYSTLAYHTPKSRLKLLTNAQATRNNILSHTTKLFSQAGANDIVIFFFSGHGNTGCFYAHDTMVSFKDLQAIFKRIKAKTKIIFADACLSGDLRTSGSTANSSSRHSSTEVLLFLSSRSNQTSLEDRRLQNGMFTHFLVAGLKGGADANKDKIITARELFNFVNPLVKSRSQGKQIPVMWGKFDHNLTILNWNKKP